MVEAVRPGGGGVLLGRAAALIDGDGQPQPPREGEIRRMLGTQDASHALWLEDELDYCGNGFG